MILYTRNCLNCTNRALWKKLKAFAAANNIAIEERRTSRNKLWADEAKQYEIEQPFVVHSGIALSLSEDLGGLLK